MNFMYPPALIPAITAAWPRKRYDDERIPPLPPESTIRDLLSVAYHSSFLTEERRRLSIRLALAVDKDLERRFGHSVQNTQEPIVLRKPLPLTVGNVLHLAPATADEQVLLCVRQDGEALVIWALFDFGSSWYRFMRHESDSGSPPPRVFTVTSSEPGHLSVERGGEVIAVLRGGELRTPIGNPLYDGPLAGFFSSARRALYAEVLDELGRTRLDEDGADEDYPERFYTAYLERLVYHTRAQDHGGTLLFVPDALTADDSRLTDRLFIKYPGHFARTWSLLKASLVSHYRYYDLHFPLWEGVGLTKERFQSYSIEESTRQEVDDQIADSVRALSALTGVDGALVLTDRLRVIGFGAEVIAHAPTLQRMQLALDARATHTTDVQIDSFGTRHRSAFRFCSSYEDAVAIIVSQDGAVRAAKRDGPNVLMWTDITIGAVE